MYGNDSFVDRIKSFDVYRKLPQGYLQPTFVGALLSVLTFAVMGYLCVFEFRNYFNKTTTHEMIVDLSRKSENLKININLTMNRLPCSIVSLDVQDFMGSHSLDVMESLTKFNLDSSGRVIGEEIKPKKGNNTENARPEYEKVKEAIKKKEGCRLIGSIEVLKVPGNFHIALHDYAAIITKLIQEEKYVIDLSHAMHHISFGDETDIKQIQTYFNVGILNPLDGVHKTSTEGAISYEYYLDVVPTKYTDLQGKTYNANQFTANSNEIKAEMKMPTITFRYEISPILVAISEKTQSFFHIFINICAIFGGLYTVAGIIDILVYKIFRFQNKSE